jgi:hypothetical protein
MLRCPRTHGGRASARLGRSVCTVTTVGAHRRRLHGRPRTGHASSVFWLAVSWVCGALRRSCYPFLALIGHRLPVPIGNAGLDDIRRTQPSCRRPGPHGATSPRRRGSRNVHGVRRHRPVCGHARADFTSPHTCWSALKCTWDVPLCAACTFYRPRPGLVSSGGGSATWATRADRAGSRRPASRLSAA